MNTQVAISTAVAAVSLAAQQQAVSVASGSPVKPVTVYSFVHTYDNRGKVTDTRVIDMSDNGARKWLMNHHWWAITNSCMVGLTVASKDDYDRFQLERLATRFNRAS